MVELLTPISLKEIVKICPLNLFYFSIHRIKVGNKWGKFLIIIADALDIKLWYL